MHQTTPLRIAALVLAVACLPACDSNNAVPMAPAPESAPRSVEEALAVPDDQYDYAAAFADSGRGGF